MVAQLSNNSGLLVKPCTYITHICAHPCHIQPVPSPLSAASCRGASRQVSGRLIMGLPFVCCSSAADPIEYPGSVLQRITGCKSSQRCAPHTLTRTHSRTRTHSTHWYTRTQYPSNNTLYTRTLEMLLYVKLMY